MSKRTNSGKKKFDVKKLQKLIPPSRSSSIDSQGRTSSMNELSEYLGNLNLNTNYSGLQPGLEIKPESYASASTSTQTVSSGGESKKSKKKITRKLFKPDDDASGKKSAFESLKTVTLGGKKRKSRRKRKSKKRRRKPKRKSRRKTRRKTKRRKKRKY